MEIRIRIGGGNRYEPNPNKAPPVWRELPEAKAFDAAVERRDRAIMAAVAAPDDARDEMRALAEKAIDDWSKAGNRLYGIPPPKMREVMLRGLPALAWVMVMLSVPTLYRILTGNPAYFACYLPGLVVLVLFLKTLRYRTERVVARLLARNAAKVRAEEADKAAADFQKAESGN